MLQLHLRFWFFILDTLIDASGGIRTPNNCSEGSRDIRFTTEAFKNSSTKTSTLKVEDQDHLDVFFKKWNKKIKCKQIKIIEKI